MFKDQWEAVMLKHPTLGISEKPRVNFTGHPDFIVLAISKDINDNINFLS